MDLSSGVNIQSNPGLATLCTGMQGTSTTTAITTELITWLYGWTT